MNSFSSSDGNFTYCVVHETSYVYEMTVTLSQQYLHLIPRIFSYQQCFDHKITIEPSPSDDFAGVDYFGNHTKHITIVMPHKELFVRTEATIVLSPRPQISSAHCANSWESLRDAMCSFDMTIDLDVYQYLHNSLHVECSDALREYALASFTPNRPLLEAAFDLTQRIYQEFTFDNEATDISTPLEEVLKGRKGVCQDFAHLMIGCLRSIGLPARYISGYILTHPPAGQPRMVGTDASHAWVSIFCADLGWIDFDPTNCCLVQHEHITLGWGRDFSDVTPMRGIVLGGGEQSLEVRVTVTPL